MDSINWSAPNIWVSIAQLVEHCSANAEAMGSNLVEALILFFFWFQIWNFLNWDYSYCDYHISISSVFSKFKLTVHFTCHSCQGWKMNSINWSAPNIWVFIAQLVEHGCANAEAMGSNPVEALKKKFRAKIYNCLNCKYNCDDHISILSVFPQFKSSSFHLNTTY